MDEMWTNVAEAPLYAEHLLLGAQYLEDEPLLAAPASYGDVREEQQAQSEAAALCDLSGMSIVLAHGEGTEAFVSAACAGRVLAVGECAFGAVVSGDGSLTCAPLVARTGDQEFLLLDPLERGLALMPWLGFLAGIEQNGFRPFEGVQVEDVSTSLHPLLLWGPQVPSVLGDYLAPGAELPASGQVSDVMLDRIACLCLGVPVETSEPCYLLLVPPQAARVLWRSFLSFPVVTPVGTQALRATGSMALAWLESLLAKELPSLSYEDLLAWDLIRAEGGFVGERGLRPQ